MFKMIDKIMDSRIVCASIPVMGGLFLCLLFWGIIYERTESEANLSVMINCEEITTGELYQARTYGGMKHYYTPEKAILEGKAGMTYFLYGEPLIVWRKHYALVAWELEDGKVKTFTFRDKEGDRVFRNLHVEDRIIMSKREIKNHNHEE